MSGPFSGLGPVEANALRAENVRLLGRVRELEDELGSRIGGHRIWLLRQRWPSLSFGEAWTVLTFYQTPRPVRAEWIVNNAPAPHSGGRGEDRELNYAAVRVSRIRAKMGRGVIHSLKDHLGWVMSSEGRTMVGEALGDPGAS